MKVQAAPCVGGTQKPPRVNWARAPCYPSVDPGSRPGFFSLRSFSCGLVLTFAGGGGKVEPTGYPLLCHRFFANHFSVGTPFFVE